MVEITEIPADEAESEVEQKQETSGKRAKRPKSKNKSKKDKLKDKYKMKKVKLEKNEEAVDDNQDEDDDESDSGNGEESSSKKTDVYLPSMPIGDDEELVCDPRAYLLHHQIQTGYPCLSFDVIPDSRCKSNQQTNFDCYIAAGTQAERKASNRILVMKLENLNVKPPKDDSESDSDSEASSSESEDEGDGSKPRLSASAIRHSGVVNRIKFCSTNNLSKPLVAAWSEEGAVGIYDVTAALFALNSRDFSFVSKKVTKKERNLPRDVKADEPLVYRFEGHKTEGFALDWSPTIAGQLISGDCSGNIHLLTPRESGVWSCDIKRPFSDHEESVEDLQWSPTEKSVFASCSADSSVRVWDVRAANRKSQLSVLKAHDSDVNVIAWNRSETSLLLSGGDDSALKVWDFRNFNKPVAHFKHHTAPITSVQWCPHDSSVFAASGEDDQLTLWDCSVEPDDCDEANETSESDVKVPSQLLFIHMGQKEIKELRWYPHSEGVIMSVASTGLDIFRTISV